MKSPARRYQSVLLCALLALSSLTIQAHWTDWGQRLLKITQSGHALSRQRVVSAIAAHSSDKPAPANTAERTNDSAAPEAQHSETALAPLQSGSNFNLTQAVVAGGGGASAGGSQSLTGSAGQGVVGASSGDSFSVSGGFWSGGGACPAITIAPPTLTAGIIGAAYSQSFTQTGGAGPLTWSLSAGMLPGNLTLNPANGLLSGAPTSFGAFNFTVRVTDANGCTGERAYTFVINACPAVTIAPLTLPPGTAGAAFTQRLTGAGGLSPYSFSLIAGALPGGLSLSAGALSGIPANTGTFNFTLKVTDANGCAGAQAYTLVINCPAITINPQTLPSGVVNTAYIHSFTQTGGIGAFAFSLSAGALPMGLDLSATGMLSGTPTQNGAFNFSVKVTDANGCAGAGNYTLVIAPNQVVSVSAATYLGQELAQESIVAAFGTDLATRIEVATTTPLPTTLAGTTVKLRDSVGTDRSAPLFFVSPQQINYQLPPGTASVPATLTIFSGDNKISVGAVQVSRVAPGLFSANSTGQGLAAAVVLRIRNGVQTFEPVVRFDAEQNRFLAVPIDLGSETDSVYLLLYGVGVRNRAQAENISINLGGVVKLLDPAKFEDAFAVAGLVGLDQVNLLLPRNLAGLGEINVTLTVEGKQSNTITINIK